MGELFKRLKEERCRAIKKKAVSLQLRYFAQLDAYRSIRKRKKGNNVRLPPLPSLVPGTLIARSSPGRTEVPVEGLSSPSVDFEFHHHLPTDLTTTLSDQLPTCSR